MKQWYLGLAPRERVIVAGGGAIAVLSIAYVLAIEPLVHGVAEREQRIAALEQDRAWMQEAIGEVEALRAEGGDVTVPDDDRPAYLAVDDAISAAGLPRPNQLTPDGNDAARVDFAEVEFDRLMIALGELERSAGIHVTRARFDRLDDGFVEAELTLERAGS